MRVDCESWNGSEAIGIFSSFICGRPNTFSEKVNTIILLASLIE
jgi:hypothetical protein